MKAHSLTVETAFETTWLEDWRGELEFRCSGEMRRYRQEHQWRRRALWTIPDAQARKLGERTGLDTPVVLAVNGATLGVGGFDPFRAEANALSVAAWGVRSQD